MKDGVTSKLNANFLLLSSAGVIAMFAAIWHLLCIVGGPSWYIFARAPEPIIKSAINSTWLAPLGASLIAILMVICSFYAFSAAGIWRKLPLLNAALLTVGSICTLRGIIAIPLLVSSKGIDIWQVIASSVWFYTGLCFIYGYLNQRHLKRLA